MAVLNLNDPVNGTTADATLIATNNAATKTVVNGGLDDGNIASGAAIALSKLAGYPSDNTKFARGDGTWAAPVAGGFTPPTPATSLPGSPTNLQQAILVDSTSAPTYAWTYQYSSAASAWIFIGGAPAVASDNTNTARSVSTNGSYQDFTGQPTFTIPRAGKYVIQVSAQITGDVAGETVQLSYKVGSTASSDNDSSLSAFSSSVFGSAISPAVSVTCAASDVIKVQVKATTGHTITLTNSSLLVIPKV